MFDHAFAEGFSESGDVDLKGLRGRRRRTLAPDVVDEAVTTHGLRVPHEEDREHEPLPLAAELHVDPVTPDNDGDPRSSNVIMARRYSPSRLSRNPPFCRSSTVLQPVAAVLRQGQASVIEDRLQSRPLAKETNMRLMAVLVVSAVATVVTASSALGSMIPVRPDDQAGVKGPGAIGVGSVAAVRPDDKAGARGPGANAVVPVAAVRPDDRAGVKGLGAIAPVSVTAVRPDDRAGRRGPGAFAVPATTPNVEIVRASSDGFDWPAAFVGAASTLGLCLLVGAALLLRPRGRTTATS